jgi:hypothetical protein
MAHGEAVEEYRRVLAQGLKGSKGLVQGQKRNHSCVQTKQAVEKTKMIKNTKVDATNVFDSMRKGDLVDVLEELCADKTFGAAFASVEERLRDGGD